MTTGYYDPFNRLGLKWWEQEITFRSESQCQFHTESVELRGSIVKLQHPMPVGSLISVSDTVNYEPRLSNHDSEDPIITNEFQIERPEYMDRQPVWDIRGWIQLAFKGWKETLSEPCLHCKYCILTPCKSKNHDIWFCVYNMKETFYWAQYTKTDCYSQRLKDEKDGEDLIDESVITLSNQMKVLL